MMNHYQCLSVLGGRVSGEFTNTGEVYDAGVWRPLPPMKHARHNLAVVTDGKMAYALGGTGVSDETGNT